VAAEALQARVDERHHDRALYDEICKAVEASGPAADPREPGEEAEMLTLGFTMRRARKMLGAAARTRARAQAGVNDQKLEAALAAFACVRLARELLDKYPENVRSGLLVDVVDRRSSSTATSRRRARPAAGLLIN
jgi:hypothetical protein